MYDKVLGKSSSICWFSFTKPFVKSMLNYAKQTTRRLTWRNWNGRIMCNKDLCRSTLSADRWTYNAIGRHVDRLSVDMPAESVDRQRSLLHMILVFKMTSFHCFVKFVVKLSASFNKFLLNFILRKIRFINLHFLISVQFDKFAFKQIRMSLMAISAKGFESKKYWWFRNGKASP